MNIIICDDRIDDRKNLSDLLSDYGEKKNYEFAITEYDSGEQLCEEQSALEACQLLFLDINMQGMDGLKTAMRIKEKYPKLPVVLVTAYMNYALDGYKVKASRFLLKDNLADTIEECMDDLIAEINKNRRILEFRFVEGTIKLYADDIIYIETELHKNVFYTEKGTFQIYKKLDELENEFKDMGFVRAHLSFLVNMRYITKISGYVMTLTTGKKIPVPKARYAQVKREYMLYKGEERIKIAVLTEQNQKNRIADYQDREEIYERQRRKMHDYKNQLSTIQTLIKNGHTDEALSFTQKLTESIAVEMSAINTNHPVVNAVLNQKYRSMQEKHIAVILKVGDLQEICLEEEEIVILLSNLLDNAIRESEKVLKNTGKAVIHLKLECEEHKLIFAVRNPVTEKVEIENDTIKSKRGDHHGIGLLNVKAVVDKYGGDMVLSCDENEFKAVVIL